MGANLCTLFRHPKPNGTKDGMPSEGSLSFKSFIKPKCSKTDDQNGKNTHNLKRETELEATDVKACKARKMTLKDWIEASPGLNPDYIRRGEYSAFKHSKKRVHPSSSQARRSSICEAKDSLTLERPMMYQCHHEEAGAKAESSSPSRSSSGKSVKMVTFKLPPTVIFYSPAPETDGRKAQYFRPNNPNFNEASFHAAEEPYYGGEDPFYSSVEPFCKGDSFDISPCPRLAVHTLPLVSVSSSFIM